MQRKSYPQGATIAPRFCPSGRPAPPKGGWAKISPLSTSLWITPEGTIYCTKINTSVALLRRDGHHGSE